MRIRNLAVLIILVCTCYSCSKVKEVVPSAGASLPYGEKIPVSTARLIDSIPDLSIFRVIYRNSDAIHYLDSARTASGKTDQPFTLFAPKDAAWQQAGYTLASAAALSREQCNALVLYLLVPGRLLADSLMPTVGGTMLYPVIQGINVPYEDEWGTVYNGKYTYSLDLAWHEREVVLNGNHAGTISSMINASDGALYLLDTVIRKPERSVYEELVADTAYSFYLAALEKSSAIYTEYKAGISPGDRNEEIFFTNAEPFNNYLSTLKKFIPTPAGTSNKFANTYIVFAPDNNAFRKAGFNDIDDIERFINKSYVTTDTYKDVSRGYPMYTNMDSALSYSFIVPAYTRTAGFGVAFNYEQTLKNLFRTLPYTANLESSTVQQGGITTDTKIDFYDWATFDENTYEFAINASNGSMKWLFGKESGRISLRRGDIPNGRVAYIVPAHSNITALNGVIHRIDNLLLNPQ
ncbi:fasciclin domain-containing protein [Chitinophaga sp. ARDCPP14]|uniref:fasciclin domain-containing protein n=1 Tax=Chitinophaga sp. ARDCPP14 TaxID=3391139 RepID=UPI003F51CCA3